MKIYTKTGDGSTTSLATNERIAKDDARVESYGTIDELAAQIALLTDFVRAEGELLASQIDWLEQIQNDLMTIEAIMAGVDKPLPETFVERLERQIDEMSTELPPLKGFTIPGGHPVVSLSHVCRTVCRRAERRTITASRQYPTPKGPLQYLNRLSDWLYIFGRKASKEFGVVEKFSIFAL